MTKEDRGKGEGRWKMIKMEKGKEGLMEEDDVERKRGVMDVYSERGRQRASEDDEEGKKHENQDTEIEK